MRDAHTQPLDKLLTQCNYQQTQDSSAEQAHCPRPSWAGPRMERMPYENGTAPADDEKYTLLLNSFKRHHLLKASIAHYAQCPGLDAIHVVWCEDQVRSPWPLLNSASASKGSDDMTHHESVQP